MKTIHHNRWVRAFTLPEVTLAIGVVALGLVAVFSILPFGLTAQKDNRKKPSFATRRKFCGNSSWRAV